MAPQDNATDGARPIRRLLLIQTLAGLAQWLDIFLIFSVPSFVWKSSPAEIAMLASCFGLPSLLLGPIVGAFLDRADPRRTMMVGALARTLSSVLITFASWFPLFAVLVLLKGLANLLYWPSSSIVTNRVVPEAERVKYFSSLSAFDQITKIGTPLVAGFLTLAMNSQLSFIVSALATLICAALLPRVTATIDFVAPAQKRSVDALLKDLLFGLRSITTLPFNLLLSVALGIGMSLALAVYDPHLAAFLGSKGFDASVFSMVVSATGAGAVVGAALIRFAFKEASPIALIRSGVAAFAAAVTSAAAVVTFAPHLLAPSTLIALWFLNGLGYEVFVVGCSVNTQNLCPPALLGRMSTSVRSLQMTAVVLGPSLGAWLISTHSRATPFIAAAAMSMLLLTIAMAFGHGSQRSARIVA
jgi:MFS family permease